MTAVLPEIGEVTAPVGRHRAPEDATTGSMGAVPSALRSRSAHRYRDSDQRDGGAGRRPSGSAPAHPLSRAARTAGLSLAALGAVATAGGMATHGFLGAESDTPSTGETAIAPQLASADMALAPAGTPSSVSDAAATQVMPAVSTAGSSAAAPRSTSPNTRAAAAAAQQAAEQRASDQSAPSSGASSATSAGSSIGARALEAARSKIGVPYVYGANGPNAFDCSSLMQYAFRQAGVSLPRVADAQAQEGQEVSMDNLQPGDLIFFYSPISHVAMYAGNGQVVQAPQEGEDVKMSPLSSMMDDAVSARRITG